MRGHAEDEAPTHAQDAADLTRRHHVVADVLEHVRREHQIERPIVERKRRSHRTAEQRAAARPGQRERPRIRLDADDAADRPSHRHVPAGAAAEIQDSGPPALAVVAAQQIREHEPPPAEPPVMELLGMHDPVLFSAHGSPGIRSSTPGLRTHAAFR